ncbi:MAG: zf-HC2 domain-containing protein [Spirochaetales bacterium]|nr:zf-HC2 domain-containing protein [Spirochaetales bacterium]
MCPEKELLSAYYDGELESPWSDRIRDHLKICEECAAKINGFKELSIFLKSDSEPSVAEVMGRVRQTIQAPEYKWRSHLWDRRVSLPMPLLAVAAVFLIVVGFLFAYRVAVPVSTPSQVIVSTDNSGRTELQISAPVQDMETLIKLLEEQGSFEEVIFQLPSEGEIWSQGEPELIRAVDFNRSGQ